MVSTVLWSEFLLGSAVADLGGGVDDHVGALEQVAPRAGLGDIGFGDAGAGLAVDALDLVAAAAQLLAHARTR